VAYHQRQRGPRGRVRRSLGSLGDDTLAAMDDQTWKQKMLEGQRDLIAAQKHWADGDRFQKWVSIGATLAIPLSAAIWRALGVGRRARRSR
jgi:hypothetical protein